ncbi:hypothetical protein FRC10_000338 [Ceratobasidium sp. 414]|nr:hypothetical protein FRC10_000338 [Ceratobasidium sp. 414]
MFSPAAKSVRLGVFRHVVLDLGTPDESQPDEPQNHDPELVDPETLSEDEQAALYDLEDLEEQFNMYLSVEINPALANFSGGFQSEVSRSDPISILSTLSPTDPESRHISYRLRGLQSLTPSIQAIMCFHPGLVSQRDDLLTAVKVEIERLLSELWDQLQQQISTHEMTTGVRRVPVDNRSINPYSSPLATSAIVLTAVAHTIMGLARTHCNFLLESIRAFIYMTAKTMNDGSADPIRHHLNEIPITLPTALHRLNLSPTFDLYACCLECFTLYPWSTSAESTIPATCTAQNLDGIVCGTELSKTLRRGTRTWQRPTARYSHMRFETWVSELLLRPGFEDMLEAARPNPNPGPVAEDVWDAPYLRTFPGPAHPNFMNVPSTELSLIMMLYFDFFNPFENKTSGKLRSVGCFFMICLNLPPDIRYNPSNCYLVSVVPGPSVPRLEEQHKLITPIVSNMLEMYSPGVWISKTHKYPTGRRVRAAVAIKSMDTEAARGASGFASHSHTCFCHLCSAKLSEIDCSDLTGFHPRMIETHRQIVALWQEAQTLQEQRNIYSEFGVRYIDWLRFSWWDPFASLVPGPMHWGKNMIDKHMRKSMEWNWALPAGVPDLGARAGPPISTLEYEWGCRAFLTLNEADFKSAKLTAPLVHYMCRQRGIFEAGLSSQRLLSDLNDWENIHTPNMGDVAPASTQAKKKTSILGYEVLSEVKKDMEQTILPSWLKHPPIGFATVSHGKLQAEEYKSLVFVSFTLTLVRLWGQDNTIPHGPLRERLDNFLHLMLTIRILSFQSLTELDIVAFEQHYSTYLQGLKRLYPSSSFVPVQHYGLHIPQFLRALGPSTRYSESTCEQFVGMFQNISTNFKFGMWVWLSILSGAQMK